MNRFQYYLVFLFSFLFLSTGFSQQNVIKLGLGSALWTNVHLKYERAIGEKASLQVGVLWDTPSKFLRTEFSANDFDFAVNKRGFMVIPEFRYYLGKKDAPAGFYLGAYSKIGRTVLYENDIPVTNEKIPTDFMVNTNQFAFGGTMGVNFIINESFSIDWNIMGIGFNYFSTNFSFESDEDLFISKEEQIEEFREFLEGNDETSPYADRIINITEEAIEQVDGTSFTSRRFRYGLLDLRFGVSIGYAF